MRRYVDLQFYSDISFRVFISRMLVSYLIYDVLMPISLEIFRSVLYVCRIFVTQCIVVPIRHTRYKVP